MIYYNYSKYNVHFSICQVIFYIQVKSFAFHHPDASPAKSDLVFQGENHFRSGEKNTTLCWKHTWGIERHFGIRIANFGLERKDLRYQTEGFRFSIEEKGLGVRGKR
jgi:hypothetical protein